MILTTEFKIAKTGSHYGEIAKTQRVEVECDCCHKHYIAPLYSAEKAIKVKGNTFCRSCRNKENIVSYNVSCTGKTLRERGYTEESIKAFVDAGQKASVIACTGASVSIETKRKLSKAFSGDKNPMYGKPSPQGSGNGWSGWYKDWYFRSLKELSYMINVIEKQNMRWESAEKAIYKIPYLDPITNNKRTYTADFLIGDTLIEIKPESLKNSLLVKTKAEAAFIWCKERSLTYKIETEKTFKQLTLKEIIDLYDKNVLIFLDRYNDKFRIWRSTHEVIG